MSFGGNSGYDTYSIVPRDGGKAVKHARVTTVAGTLDSTEGLTKWKMRMVAIGLAARPDLMALVAVTNPSQKWVLNRACDDAKEAAAASSSANTGTALHTLTERIDAGEKMVVPPMFRKDLAAYQRAIKKFGVTIDPHFIERVCVCGSLDEPVAGTIDRIATWRRKKIITDLKTGQSLDFGWWKIAIQLAIYAHADSLYDRETEEHETMPAVDQERAIVFHLPAGKGVCTPYLVDLVAGWQAAQQAVAVRQWRKRKNLSELMEAA